MTINSLQVGFFLNTINLLDKLSIAKNINTVTNNIFDGEPLILPIPENAPPEIPRIILKTKQEDLIMNVSYSRIDIIFENKQKKIIHFNELKEKFNDLIKKITISIYKNFSATTKRLGLVTMAGYDVKNPIAIIYKKFDKRFINELKDSKEIQAHIFKQEKISKFKINNWIRIIAQEVNDKRDKFNILNDLNIQEDNKEIIGLDDVILFYQKMLDYNEQNLNKYASTLFD